MKLRFIFEYRQTFKVGRMCKLLNVFCSGYHGWVKRLESRRSRENYALEAKIRFLHAVSHGIYGAPRIHQDLIYLLQDHSQIYEQFIGSIGSLPIGAGNS